MSESTTYEPVDRTGWPSGTWDGEPDRAEWKDEATGMPCLAKRNGLGAWCGYVAVNPEHPLHSVAYEELRWPDVDPEIEVHGGLTYSDSCSGEICHVPAPGEPDDVWWFGFDCAHSFDFVPTCDEEYAVMNAVSDLAESILGVKSNAPDGLPEYRDLDYVKGECTKLAAQLAAVA